MNEMEVFAPFKDLIDRGGRERAGLGLQVMIVYVRLYTALIRMTFKLRFGTDVKEKKIRAGEMAHGLRKSTDLKTKQNKNTDSFS